MQSDNSRAEQYTRTLSTHIPGVAWPMDITYGACKYAQSCGTHNHPPLQYPHSVPEDSTVLKTHTTIRQRLTPPADSAPEHVSAKISSPRAQPKRVSVTRLDVSTVTIQDLPYYDRLLALSPGWDITAETPYLPRKLNSPPARKTRNPVCPKSH